MWELRNNQQGWEIKRSALSAVLSPPGNLSEPLWYTEKPRSAQHDGDHLCLSPNPLPRGDQMSAHQCHMPIPLWLDQPSLPTLRLHTVLPAPLYSTGEHSTPSGLHKGRRKMAPPNLVASYTAEGGNRSSSLGHPGIDQACFVRLLDPRPGSSKGPQIPDHLATGLLV